MYEYRIRKFIHYVCNGDNSMNPLGYRVGFFGSPFAMSLLDLQLESVIGFAGDVRSGLLLHPDDEHVLYPLGSTIVVKNLKTNTQRFLSKDGHDKNVSCMALSASGKYLASGQVTHMGFQAPIIVWDLEKMEVLHKLVLHKGKVQDVTFSHDEQFVASLGGQDDNKLVIWEMSNGKAVCGTPAANETAAVVKFFNKDSSKLVTGGVLHLRVWELDMVNRKVRPTDCGWGAHKRTVNCVVIDENDEFMHVGTVTGDILQVGLGPKLLKDQGPKKKCYSLGVTAILLLPNGNYLIGTGDGTVAILDGTFKQLKVLQLKGGVSSLVLNAARDHFFVGTNQSNIYLVSVASFEFEIRSSCHYGVINAIAYPYDYSELFATCSSNDIRVWHARNRTELLRIQVPNLVCLSLAFSRDGKAILSGWSDGKVRAFKPQSGALLFTINDAHTGGVTALVASSDSSKLVTGGGDGRVRIWAINKNSQALLVSLKEHKGVVSSLCMKSDDSECVSASSDGSCISWDMKRYVRSGCLFASTQFASVSFFPDESQLLTTGSDRKITYWDAVDSNAIRIIDGSQSAAVNALSISSDGEMFASGGNDRIVKLWNYDEGHCYYYGVGHSGDITDVKISPDMKQIVSVGSEGSIFLWKYPTK